MGFFSDLLGPVLGGTAGYLLAPFTGGLSVPASMALGAGLGGVTQGLIEGAPTESALLKGGLGALGAYGVGNLLPTPIGATTLSSSAPSISGFSLPGSTETLSSIGAAGSEVGLGTSGLPLATETGTGFALPGTTETLAKIGAVPALTSGGTAGATGVWPTVKKWGPLVLGADYLAKSAGIGTQQGATQEALNQYLSEHKAATEWTPEDRQKFMKSIMGIYAEDVGAAKRKASSSLAERGIGGGEYGKKAKRIERQGREAAARSLSKTFGPSGAPPSPSAFFANAAAKGRSAGAETAQDVLGLGGNLASLYLLKQLFA